MTHEKPTEESSDTQAPLHTPAPWFVVADHDPEHRHIQTGADVSAVCENIATAWGGGNVPVEANAKLIAAAPDLLAAARIAVEASLIDSDWPGIAELKAAIREATGDPTYMKRRRV